MRFLVLAFVSFLVSLPVARETAADPPPLRGLGMALRKDIRADDGLGLLHDPKVETLATLVNLHSGEAVPLSATEPSADRFSALLKDRVTGSVEPLDPRLLDLLRALAKDDPGIRIELVSGYRSPKLNEMLRKKERNVASNSQHTEGNAVDFRIVGLTPAQMKKRILATGWNGGIGQYDKPTDLFVHADVGPKREWREAPRKKKRQRRRK